MHRKKEKSGKLFSHFILRLCEADLFPACVWSGALEHGAKFMAGRYFFFYEKERKTGTQWAVDRELESRECIMFVWRDFADQHAESAGRRFCEVPLFWAARLKWWDTFRAMTSSLLLPATPFWRRTLILEACVTPSPVSGLAFILMRQDVAKTLTPPSCTIFEAISDKMLTRCADRWTPLDAEVATNKSAAMDKKKSELSKNKNIIKGGTSFVRKVKY